VSAAEAAQFNALINAIAQSRQRNYSAGKHPLKLFADLILAEFYFLEQLQLTAFLAYVIFSTFKMVMVHIWKQR
jgi:hypothetical protein